MAQLLLKINFCFVLTCIAIISSGAPQKEEEIEFTGSSITLSGTLVKPEGEGLFPAVIFVHGSGPEDRNNMLDFARAFASHGYAGLVYDKRGVGKSGGDRNSVQYYSFNDLSDDAVGAVEFLSKRNDINSKRIGITAVSQGGWVAPLAASKSKKIAFMIILSGSVSTVGEDNIFERAARLKKEGFSETDIQQANEMHFADIALTRNVDSLDNFKSLWDKYKTAVWFKRVYVNEDLLNPYAPYRKWYKTVVDFNPVNYLENLNLPILWLYGDPAKDRFCPVSLSLNRLEELKKKGKKYHIRQFEKADHGLKVDGKMAPFDAVIIEWLRNNKL
jgi:uncharacterized protein